MPLPRVLPWQNNTHNQKKASGDELLKNSIMDVIVYYGLASENLCFENNIKPQKKV